MGDDTNASIPYPVTFINLPIHKVVVNELPSNLNLSVQGRGYNILRYKTGKTPDPVVINLSRLNHIIAKETTMEFNLATDVLFEEIKSQLPTDLQLTKIKPDTIYFVFSNYSEKRVPIEPTLDINFDTQCKVDGNIDVNPREVVVSGPNIILDTLKSVKTKPITARRARNDIKKNIELEPISGLAFQTHRVDVEVPISKFTEAVINVPITVVGAPDSLRTTIMPNDVEVSFWVSMNDYSHINKNDFRVEANVNNADSLLGMQLALKLTTKPQNVFNIRITPEVVNFVFE